ncbi:MAG TPA: hypothetical protein VMW72_06810 [Sedimentisphaerales bacterium]|nr:hypothetical protein [Sedimentisphaerales bacterium]
MIFKDTFPSAAIDTTKWTVVDGATVESVGVGEPSRKYSFYSTSELGLK